MNSNQKGSHLLKTTLEALIDNYYHQASSLFPNLFNLDYASATQDL